MEEVSVVNHIIQCMWNPEIEHKIQLLVHVVTITDQNETIFSQWHVLSYKSLYTTCVL